VVTPGLYVQRVVQVPRTATGPAGFKKRNANIDEPVGEQYEPDEQVDKRANGSTGSAGYSRRTGHARIGLPTMRRQSLAERARVILHSVDGVIGMGPGAGRGRRDYDLINAGKQPVTLLPGGCYSITPTVSR